MNFFQILPSLEKYGIHTMGCSIWGLTRFQSLWRSKLCELSCHFTLWNSQRSSGVSKILIKQSKILNNVNSSMQSSAGKGIVIRAIFPPRFKLWKSTLAPGQIFDRGRDPLPFKNLDRFGRPWILAFPFSKSDQIDRPWILGSPF